MRLVPYHWSEDTLGGESCWRTTRGPAKMGTMVELVAYCHGVKDHHGEGSGINVTCCHGVEYHHDDGSWIITDDFDAEP